MRMSREYLKEELKKIKPLYGWFCKKRHTKSCDLLQLNCNEIFKKIYEVLNGSNICYFYTYGTLLGLIRDGKVMKYDDDIDVGILLKEDFSWKYLESILINSDFTKLHEFTLDGIITEQTYQYKGTCIDFFMYEYLNNKMISYVYFNKKDLEYSNIFQKSVTKLLSTEISEFKELRIKEVIFQVPVNAEEYLEDIYGKTWRIPNPNWISENGPAWNELENNYGIYVPYKLEE